MVTQFGMSDKLGNVDLSSNYANLSMQTKMVIEQEVRRTIEEARQRATDLLVSKRKELDLLAQALVNYETLNKDEAFKVIKGEKLEGKMLISDNIKRPDRKGPPNTGIDVAPIPGSPAAEDAARPSQAPPPSPGGVMA